MLDSRRQDASMCCKRWVVRDGFSRSSQVTVADLELQDARWRERGRGDAPRLVFEITSEDGFHVRADSCEGEWG